MINTSYTPGTAPIKSEFILLRESRSTADDDIAESSTNHIASAAGPADTSAANASGEVTGAQRRKRGDEKRKKGANKGRRWNKLHDDLNLCWRLAAGRTCEFGEECRFAHDVPAYLVQKPKDIHFPLASSISLDPPFVRLTEYVPPLENPDATQDSSLDPTTTCPVFLEAGECRHGLKCRFLGGHARKTDHGAVQTIVDESKMAATALSSKEVNFCSSGDLALLRKKKYPHPMADMYIKELKLAQDAAEGKTQVKTAGNVIVVSEPDADPTPLSEDSPPLTVALSAPPTKLVRGVVDESVAQGGGGPQAMDEDKPAASAALGAPPDEIVRHAVDEVAALQDTPDVPMRYAEKKSLRWEGKTYLAPLTTVGNLPFRRLCVDLGADITCGEMGLATSFLNGSKEEWSLVRRHPSEKIFGVQMAGSKPSTLVPAAEAISRICASGLDFVDLNCGCPIDLVFKTGSGSALLDAAGRLSKSLIGMSKVLGEIPLTVKLRTGIKDGHNMAHKLMPRILDWGVSAMTLHGRTRQQRYARLADWAYIKTCVAAVRAREADESLPRIPLFGGGDAFSAQDYWEKVDASGVDGVMVARGALIKPWVFTEIKERREWDISATERLELIRKYAEYGLSHFGTDTAGVNTTRRYLCEAISFQYRYIPIGLLEVLPGRINDRPPAFKGRNELETLLASDDSRDWVKISEMFLGPAPETWNFMPKHKSNSYESQG